MVEMTEFLKKKCKDCDLYQETPGNRGKGFCWKNFPAFADSTREEDESNTVVKAEDQACSNYVPLVKFYEKTKA